MAFPASRSRPLGYLCSAFLAGEVANGDGQPTLQAAVIRRCVADRREPGVLHEIVGDVVVADEAPRESPYEGVVSEESLRITLSLALAEVAIASIR